MKLTVIGWTLKSQLNFEPHYFILVTDHIPPLTNFKDFCRLEAKINNCIPDDKKAEAIWNAIPKEQ